MTTTAVPGTPARPTAGQGAPAAGTGPAPGAEPGTRASSPAGAGGAQARPSGFRGAVVLAVLLTVPAVYLVARGELSAHDALVRFGCAWAFATAGVALVLSTVGGGSVAVPGHADTPDGGAADGSGERPTAEAGDGDSAAAYPDPGAGARQD